MAWWPFGKSKDVRQQQNDPLVQSVKKYVSSTGFDLDDGTIPSREKALQFVPFARCINLLTSQAAELVTSTVHVVDDRNNLVDTEDSRRMVRLLKHSPNSIQSAHSFLMDIMGDYLIDGNAVIHAQPSSADGTPGTLVRLGSSGAETQIADPKRGLESLVYVARPFMGDGDQRYSAKEIIHARFMPTNNDKYGDASRSLFASSNLKYLARAIRIGIQADAWVGDFFDTAAKNNLVIECPDTMDPAAAAAISASYQASQTSKRNPLFLTGGASAKELNPSPTDADAANLREFQVQEIGRYYGVPAPILGLHVTQWGAGIEHLARLYFRFAVRMHLSNVLKEMSFRMLKRNQRFEVDATQEVKGDMAAISQFISACRPNTNGPGIISREEARAILGLFGEYIDDWDWEGYGADDEDVDNDEPIDDNDRSRV